MVQAPQLIATIPFKICTVGTLPPAPGGGGAQQVKEAGIIDRTLRSLPVFVVHQENKITPISNRNNMFSQGLQAVYRSWVRIAFSQMC